MSQYMDDKDLFLESKTTQYGSHMVMTNVHKPTKVKYLNIDTRFRDDMSNYASTSNSFNITLPDRITDVKSISITNVEIPICYYNISTTIGNNCIKFTRKNTTNTIVIVLPDGQYDSTSLVTELNHLLSLTSFTDISVAITNNKTIITTSNHQYTIDFDVDVTGVFDRFNFKRKLGWVLGFRSTTYDLLTSTPNLRSEGSVDLNGPRYLFLAVDEFSKGNQSSFITPLPNFLINKHILGRISTDSHNFAFGSVLTANRMNGMLVSDSRSYTGKIDLLKLNIQLLDDYGIPVNLTGNDFSFCLQIQHE